jgi:hypothetical protein
MLTRIVCPNCGHVGATDAALLPRVLICSQCGHGALIKSGKPATRFPIIITREEDAFIDGTRSPAQACSKRLNSPD